MNQLPVCVKRMVYHTETDTTTFVYISEVLCHGMPKSSIMTHYSYKVIDHDTLFLQSH